MNWINPRWPVAKNINAAVTLRSGGVSKGNFYSFNLATHVNDDFESVYRNRQILSSMLKLPAEPVWLHQVHGNQVIKADCSRKSVEETADASYTDQPNTVCAVLTADCLPILLASAEGTKIAVIHAGWKGLLSGVISNTVNELGTINVIAWLGPAIGPDCFEVGCEIRRAFVDRYSRFAPAFAKKNKEKYLADIYQLAKIEFASLGITKIYGGNFCTLSEKEHFYSYRREGETGRMATLIWRN